MDSDGTCENSPVSGASCKLMPLGRDTFWMLKLANFRKFHRCPSMGVHGGPTRCPGELRVAAVSHKIGDVKH